MGDPLLWRDDTEEVSLVRIANVLLRNRRVLIALPLAAAFLVVVVGLLSPREYTSRATFVAQESAGQLSRLAGMAAQFGVDVPGGETTRSPEFYADLLQSRGLLRATAETEYRFPEGDEEDAAVREGTLVDIFEIDEERREVAAAGAVEELRDIVSVETSTETGVVQLGVTSRWPALSQQIAARMMGLVNDFNLESRQSHASAERRFTAERLEEARTELTAAEASLERFLDRNRSYMNSPQLTFEHDRLQRQVDLRQQVFSSLAESHEQARIDEVRNTPVITVVDPPEAPAIPDRRGLILRAFVALVLGGIVALLWAFGRQFMSSSRERDPEEYREFSELRRDAKADVRRLGRRVRRVVRRGPKVLFCLGVVLLPALLTAPDSAAAQDTEQLRQRAEQILGRPISEEEIRQYLRQSGMAPEQLGEQFQREGTTLAPDQPYVGVVGRPDLVRPGLGQEVPGQLPADAALPDTLSDVSGLGAGMHPVQEQLFIERLLMEREREQGPPIFGRELFLRAGLQFQPVTTGPAPRDYRLGPEDELVLVLTGDVEEAYRLTVTREGWIVVPDVGRLFVSGKTLAELEEDLYDRLSQVYSGITRGPEATTFFDVSLGSLRTNQIYVIGEVERPAAYTVSSLGTALTALYHAGGPSRSGSFRHVDVIRGGETVQRIDLYDYLLRGRAEQDIRLEQGDVVFVPLAERRVRVEGVVERPGIYEIGEGETLVDVLDFAGGVRADAELSRVQVERVLPPEAREPGRDRTIMDVAAGEFREEEEGFRLRDGDRITVFAVLDDVRNQVTVSGAVWRPGTYGADEGTRLWDIVQRAGGLLPDAYEGRAQIQRLQEDYTRRLIPVELDRDAEGRPADNPVVEGMDQVIVFARRDLREDRAVSIGGWVRYPGVYPYADGMSVADLILKAGGLRTGAYIAEAEVARVVISQARNDTLTRRYMVPLDSAYAFDGSDALAGGDAGAPPGSDPAREAGDDPEPVAGTDGSAGDGAAGEETATETSAERFSLRNLDAVYIRKAPGYDPQQRVVVAGQVRFPGPYSIENRGERLTDLIERAGGLTGEAYPHGFQLWRAEPEAADTLTAAEIAGRAVGDITGGEIRRDTLPTFRGGRDERPGGRQPGRDTLDDSGAEEPERDVTRTPEERRRAELVAGREDEGGERRSTNRIRVGIDFAGALRNPDGPENILVEPRDSVFVPRYIPTVDVRGAVGVPTRVLHREGAGLDYYIRQAGGYREDAAEDRVRIRFANGEVATRGGKFLIFGGGIPDPDPGSLITVPEEPEDPTAGFNVGQFAGIFSSVLTATASLIIALSR